MMCTPLSVSTIPLISPTCNANAASSKGYCIAPRSKKPKSPPSRALPQSDSLAATPAQSVPASMAPLSESSCEMACSLVRCVICLPSGSCIDHRPASRQSMTKDHEPRRQGEAGWYLPRCGAARALVLDQDVRGTNLLGGHRGVCDGRGSCGVSDDQMNKMWDSGESTHN
jgi:hypothetical protein